MANPMQMADGLEISQETSNCRKILSVKGDPRKIALVDAEDSETLERFAHPDLGIRPYGDIKIADWQMHTSFLWNDCLVMLFERKHES